LVGDRWWIRTHLNATVRWTVAATSSKTGGYFYFLSPMREKMQIESTIPHQKNRLVRQVGFSVIFALRRVILLRSDIRLKPSDIALRAVLLANITKISVSMDSND